MKIRVIGIGRIGVVHAHNLAGTDGVVVATPTPTHPELVRRCVAAGVPVMCEKPIAMERDTLLAVAWTPARLGGSIICAPPDPSSER